MSLTLYALGAALCAAHLNADEKNLPPAARVERTMMCLIWPVLGLAAIAAVIVKVFRA